MKTISRNLILSVLSSGITGVALAQTTTQLQGQSSPSNAAKNTPAPPKSASDELKLDVQQLITTLQAESDPKKRRDLVDLGHLTQILPLSLALSKGDFVTAVEQ